MMAGVPATSSARAVAAKFQPLASRVRSNRSRFAARAPSSAAMVNALFTRPSARAGAGAGGFLRVEGRELAVFGVVFLGVAIVCASIPEL